MVILTLIILGVTGLIGKSLVTTLLRDTTLIQKKNTANDQLKANLKAAPQLTEQYARLGNTRKLIADGLPTSEDHAALIAQMENMANVSGVNLRTIAKTIAPIGTGPSSVSTRSLDPFAAQPKTYLIAATVTGGFEGYKKFQQALENSVRPMRVTSTSITGSATDMTVGMEITTYYMDKATIPYKLEELKK